MSVIQALSGYIYCGEEKTGTCPNELHHHEGKITTLHYVSSHQLCKISWWRAGLVSVWNAFHAWVLA